MTIIGSITVDHSELEGSPTESGSGKGFEAVRTLKCAWSDRLTLMNELIGVTVGGISYGAMPYEHNPAALVESVDIAPFHSTGVMADPNDARNAAYSHAVLTVKYSTPDAQDLRKPATDVMNENLTWSKEVFTVPGDRLFWMPSSEDGQGKPLDAPPGLQVALMEWQVTLRNLTVLPSAAKDLCGFTNIAAMTSRKYGLAFAPETLLYDGLSITLKTTTDGQQPFDATFKLVHRDTGWNKFYNPRTGQWSDVFMEGGIDPWKPFTPASFAPLVAI